MFSIAYSKTTKKIVMAHYDGALNVELPTPQERLNQYCENNELNVNDYIAIEYTWNKNLNIIFGNHIFNELTQLIEVDPNYVTSSSQI